MRQSLLVDQKRAMPDSEPGQERFLRQARGAHFDADAADERRQLFGERIGEHRDHAAFGSAAFTSAKAQSSQGVSASISPVSTVAPHQMRRPGGASR